MLRIGVCPSGIRSLRSMRRIVVPVLHAGIMQNVDKSLIDRPIGPSDQQLFSTLIMRSRHHSWDENNGEMHSRNQHRRRATGLKPHSKTGDFLQKPGRINHHFLLGFIPFCQECSELFRPPPYWFIVEFTQNCPELSHRCVSHLSVQYSPFWPFPTGL